MKPHHIIILVLLLTSCGPAAKLRRAEKLIKKAEAQGATWHVDTVYQEIAVPIESVRLDTLIVSKPGDTVVITKDRLKLKYVRLQADTVFIDAECLPDTVYKRVPVTVNKTIEAKPKMSTWDWVILTIIVGLIGFFVGFFRKRRTIQ